MKIVCQGCGSALTVIRKQGPQRKWCSENCRKRAWDRTNRTRYRGTCADCGAQTFHKRASRCRSCEMALRAWRHEVLLSVLEGCYVAGWSYVDMGEALRREPTALSAEIAELRVAGRVPYRNVGWQDYR